MESSTSSSSTSSKILLMTILFAAILGPQTISAADDSGTAALAAKCSPEFQKVMPCLTFVTSKANAPTKECCDSATELKNDDQVCLCFIIQQIHNGTNAAVKNMGVQESRLLQLPAACKMTNASVSECPKLLHLPANSPDAAIFTKTTIPTANGTSSPTIVDSPAPPAADDIPAPNVYDDGTRSKKKGGLVLWLSSGLAILITLIIVVVITCYVNKKKKKNINTRKEEGPSPDDDKDEEADVFAEDAHMDDEFEKESGPKKFTYDELALSTNNFSEKQKLGEGGFGQVYRGFLKETESYVAVKRLSSRSKQGQKEYASEVKIISKLRHKNLVQFVGWCHRRGDLLLVYEYMPNKSLDHHLFKRDLIPLSWEVRYKVALGLASALFYLHEECEQCVLHRDIKSSNIMLDSTFNAKLGDFGLARSVDHEKGSHTTHIAGTRGYMAPESFTAERATKESDVYSFGVVLLEIACGKKPIEVSKEEVTKLVEFAWNLYGAGNVLDAADPKLCGDFDDIEMKNLLMVGLWCVHPDSNCRPKIREAKHVLNFEAPLWPNTIPRTMPKVMYYTPGTTHHHSSTVQTPFSSSSHLYPR